ncbi:MAG: SDR family oxidoreductase [Cyclobacteriaceae bacterium]
MSFNNQNLWAIILGGSSGIGLATAKKLATQGLNLCIVHRDTGTRVKKIQPTFEELRQLGVRVETFNLDASSPDQVDKICNQLIESEELKVRVLVHAISKGNLKTLVPPKSVKREKEATGDVDEKFGALDRLMESFQNDLGQLTESDLSVTTHAMCTSLLLWVRRLVKQNSFSSPARVIALSSEGNKRNWSSYAAIAMAKSSLETLIRYLAVELAPYNVTANVIQAGITDTPSLNMIPGNEIIKASTVRRNPFGRLTTGKDVADFIYLMCLDEASWINGAIIPVDGGEHFC